MATECVNHSATWAGAEGLKLGCNLQHDASNLDCFDGGSRPELRYSAENAGL